MLDSAFQLRTYDHPFIRSPEFSKSQLIKGVGRTIRQIVNEFASNLDVVASLNDEIISQDRWSSVRVRNHDILDLSPQVGFLFFWASAAAFWSTVATVAWNVALTLGLSYLGGKLLEQDLKETDSGGASENHSWDPQTTMQLGKARPRVYGRNMLHGNVIACYTGVETITREALYFIVDHGEGPIYGLDGETVYINDQPSGNYTGVTVQEKMGTMSQTAMTGFTCSKIDHQTNHPVRIWDDPWVFTTPNNYFDDVEVTVCFPNGLRKFHKGDGSGDLYSVRLKIEVSERGVGSWTTVLDYTYTYYTYLTLYFSYSLSSLGFNCVRGKQYDLRFTRISGAETGERVVSDSYIKSIREVVDVAFTYPGRALLGIKAIGTNDLSGSLPDVKCVRKGRIINVYNGEQWVLQYSNNLAWVVLDIIMQPIVSGDGSGSAPYLIERYEGVQPENVDLGFFYEWAQVCDTDVNDGKGDTEKLFVGNYIVDERRSLFSLANELAVTGRAHLYWDGMKLTGWLDIESPANEIDLVTCDNILMRSWKSRWTMQDELAGSVEVFYRDEDNGFERTSFPDANADAGDEALQVQVEAMGDTRRSGAVRLSYFTLLRNKLLRNANNFEMHKDAMRYRLGQILRVQHRLPNWGKHYRVVSVEEDHQTVNLNRDAEADGVDIGWILYVRTFDESTGAQDVDIGTYTVQSVSGSSIVIDEIFNPIPDANCIMAIEPSATGSTEKTVLRRVIRIAQRDDNFYDVITETYNASLFEADDIDPTNPNPNYIWPVPSRERGLSPLPVSWDNIQNAVNLSVKPNPSIELPWLGNVTWSADTAGTTLSWDNADGETPITLTFRGETHEVASDSVEVNTAGDDIFVYWDPDDTNVFSSTTDISVALSPGNWVVCILRDGTAYPAVPFQLIHGGLIQAGTITAEFGQIANLAVGTLQIQDNAVTIPVSAYSAADETTGDVQTVAVSATGAPIFIFGGLVSRRYFDSTGVKNYRLKIIRKHSDLFVDLVAYWPMDDDASSTPVLDVSGSDHSAILQGGKTTSDVHVAGQVGTGAFAYDGTNDYVEDDDAFWDDIFKTGIAWSVSFWCQPTSNSKVSYFIVKSAGANKHLYIFWRNDTSPKRWEVELKDDPNSVYVTKSEADPTAAWHHVAVTYDGAGDLKMYIDGAAGTQGETGTGIPDFGSTNNLIIGDSNYEGKLDAVMVWDRVITAAEIALLFDEEEPIVTLYDTGSCTVDVSVTGYKYFPVSVGIEDTPPEGDYDYYLNWGGDFYCKERVLYAIQTKK